MYKVKDIFKCLYKAAANTIDHDGIEHAGYMAFLSLLSLFPFLVFLVSIAGFIGASEVGREFYNIALSKMPDYIMVVLKPRIEEIISGPPEGLMNLAIFGAIWTASSSVEGLRTILNRVYHVTAPPPYITRRLLSIAQFFMLTLSVLCIMSILLFAPILWSKLAYLTHVAEALSPVWEYIRYTAIFCSLFGFVTTIYYFIPNIRIKWRDIIPGALLVSVIWIIFGNLLSIYVLNFKQVSLIYGSLGSIIITLIFFYVINMILIYGAEFNYLLFKLRNQRRYK
jgi:membrane protein